MQIGLQMYTLRNEAERDFAGTLRSVANVGYQGVEFAGYGGYKAAELKKLLDELNLTAIGAHVSYARLKDHLEAEAEYVQTLGCRNLIVPYLDDALRKDDEAWKQVAAQLEIIGEQCANRGMRLFYHNHDFEFRQKAAGTTAFDFLFGAVPASVLHMELDACWVHYGGYDPVGYIEKYEGRLPLVHFKDMKTLAGGKAQTVELGSGEIELERIAEAARRAGAEWLIVEQDECQNPPLDSVTTSFDWITNHIGRRVNA